MTRLILALSILAIACGGSVQILATVVTPTITMPVSTITPISVQYPTPVVYNIDTGLDDGGTVNLRACPSTRCASIAILVDGDELIFIDDDNGWYFVEFGEIVGYVYGEYVDKND